MLNRKINFAIQGNLVKFGNYFLFIESKQIKRIDKRKKTVYNADITYIHPKGIKVMKKPLLKDLTLREKIGQMLLAYQLDINRKVETDTPEEARSFEERKALIEREKFGVYWAQTGRHGRGLDMAEGAQMGEDMSAEYGAWIQAESDCYKIPALTALDAEGEGAGFLFKDLSVVCGPMAQGASNDEELIYNLAANVAKELRTAGVTWRWSPPVDIGNRFTMTIMRCHAPDDADKEIRLALAQIRGTQSQGVAATAKHFPGGDGIEFRDSHFCASQNISTMEEWWARQGKIFKGVIDGGVYSVMISHKAFPACDNSKVNGRYRPSTISKKVITDLLKGELGFKGVVITDGIVMASLFSIMPYDELIVELVNAGNDVILGVRLNTGDIIEKAVLDGRIPESRIDDACQRVLDMKEKLGMFEDGYRLVKGKAEDIVPETKKINDEIAKSAVHLVRDRTNMIPLDKSKIKNVTIICSTHTDKFFDRLELLKKEFEALGMNVKMQRRLSSEAEIKKISDESDLILYAVYVAGHQPMGGLTLFGDECKTYLWAFSHGKEKSIGVSFGYPYIHYDIMENADAFVNTYGQSPELMRSFVKALFGDIPFKGTAPMNLENNRREW